MVLGREVRRRSLSKFARPLLQGAPDSDEVAVGIVDNVLLVCRTKEYRASPHKRFN